MEEVKRTEICSTTSLLEDESCGRNEESTCLVGDGGGDVAGSGDGEDEEVRLSPLFFDQEENDKEEEDDDHEEEMVEERLQQQQKRSEMSALVKIVPDKMQNVKRYVSSAIQTRLKWSSLAGCRADKLSIHCWSGRATIQVERETVGIFCSILPNITGMDGLCHTKLYTRVDLCPSLLHEIREDIVECWLVARATVTCSTGKAIGVVEEDTSLHLHPGNKQVIFLKDLIAHRGVDEADETNVDICIQYEVQSHCKYRWTEAEDTVFLVEASKNAL